MTDVKLTLAFIIQTISDPVNLGDNLIFPVEQKKSFAGKHKAHSGISKVDELFRLVKAGLVQRAGSGLSQWFVEDVSAAFHQSELQIY